MQIRPSTGHIVGILVALCAIAPRVSIAEERSTSAAPKPLKRVDVVDDFFGTKVADPYRWLEDEQSPDTRAFVDEQNARFRAFADGPTREQFKRRIRELTDYPKIGAPRREGRRYLFSKND